MNDLDFGIGDLVRISADDILGIVISIEEDPEGDNHDVFVLSGHEIYQEFHHGVMPA